MSTRDPAAVSSSLRPAVMRALALGAALDIVVLDQISKWAVLEGIVRPAAGQGPALGIVEWLASGQKLDPVRVE
ncbi:MAG TPA: hypothetical protein PKX87_07585, partial [Alphaproteobacteria bacterium]|nr:hypothetical protein [Alphaproteobacteria bacterium]